MRFATFLVLSIAAIAGRLGAQANPPSASANTRHWAFTTASAVVPVRAGAGADLMNANVDAMSMSLRRRVGETRWWIGLDMDAWFAVATPAGVDSLAARSRVPNVYTGNGGEFHTATFAVSVQYDAWTFGPLTGYGVASAGVDRSGGTLHGQCTQYLAPCEHDPVYVERAGMTPAATAGAGLRARLFDTRGWMHAVPSRLFVEARVANQGTMDGRLMTTPLQFGFAW